MQFHMLVLEGDKEAEKTKKEVRLPVYTASAYLRRKRLESRPPLHNRSFYLCRMIEEELKGLVIDGSGRITICAHQVRLAPGDEKYICDRNFHVSIYYLEQEEINAIEEADPDTEQTVIWRILQNSLMDIARRNQCPGDVAEKMEEAFARIADSHFVREERIEKLTKRAKNTGLTAHVYRVLSAETGEGWHIKITDRKKRVRYQAAIDEDTRYINRLGSRLYAKAEWRENAFVISDNFGKEVFRINVSEE